jgi:hypothetical protein
MRFRSTFQRFVSQIEWSPHWKVLRKRIRKGWFVLRTSSFGDSMTMTMGSIKLETHMQRWLRWDDQAMKLPTTLCRYIYHSFFVIILQTCEHPMSLLSHAMCCINKWRPFWNCQTACSGSGRAHLPLNSSRVTSVTRRAFVADATHRFRRFYRGASTSWYHDDVSFHVGNNISAKYPRRICK